MRFKQVKDKAPQWKLALVITLQYLSPAVALAKHSVTLDDAYAISSVGIVDLAPAGDMLAVESAGGILVLSTAHEGNAITRLSGTNPSWSPDGTLLAHFAIGAGGRQLYVWNRLANSIVQVTDIPGGVLANAWFGSGCPSYSISWSPDSRRVVFATRITGSPTNIATLERSGRRIYNAQSPIDHSLTEGVFKEENFWSAYTGADVDHYRDKMKAIDRDPELGRSKVVAVDVKGRTWTVVSGREREYSCPTWAPNGKWIAAVADVSDQYPITYFGHLHVQSTRLSIFDFPSGAEKKITVPASRIGMPMWSPDSDRLLMVAEQHPPIFSFRRILEHSISRSKSRFIPTPQELAAGEVRWSRDGKAILVKLSDRFADSLWRLDRRSGEQQKLNTFDWQIGSFGLVAGSFSEGINGQIVFNAEGANFKGRTVLISRDSASARTIYDANPQLTELELGEQRRVTWRNNAGDEVDGIVILPPTYDATKRYPVIVCPYPMIPRDMLWLTPQYETVGQLQATRGYVVFRPSLRSPQTAGWFTRGEAYTEKARGAKGIPILVDDFTSGIDYLVKRGIADPNRIGLFGHSNGGWVTNILITETSIAKAAVIASGISNAVLMSFFPMPMITRGADPATNGNVFDNLDDYIRLSPIYKMREVKIPVLLTVGDQDWLWLPQMISQYGVLRMEGRDVELVRYSAEEHSLVNRSTIEDALSRMNSFFDLHLKGIGPSEGSGQFVPMPSQ